MIAFLVPAQSLQLADAITGLQLRLEWTDESQSLVEYLSNRLRFDAFCFGIVRNRFNQSFDRFSFVKPHFRGADGRTRTGTGLLSPTDFKSVASAISPHRRLALALSLSGLCIGRK